MGSEHYCLRWNNHQSNLLGVFSQLLQDESLVDVTLACSEGAPIRAHKVVLSACSSYFQSLFLDHPEKHPIVILKDVRFAELQTLVEFMYKGEVNVQYCQLSALLKTAESLKVKGLAEMTNQNTTLREPEREPERLRPHSQPCKRSNSCDSPVDATLSGPSTSGATSSAAAAAAASSTQHAAALAASALTSATIASNAASSTSATTNATTCTIAPSATSLVAAAFSSSSSLSSHLASSVSSKREHTSERCSPSPPKRLHGKHEQDTPLLPLDLYQRRLEQQQQQEDTKENAIVNNNNTNEKHRSTTPHTASGTTQKHSNTSEGGGGGGCGSGASGEGIKKRDDLERDSARSFNSPDRLARHDVNRPTDETMGGEGMSGGVEKIEDVEDVEYGDEEMELDDDGDNNSEDVCLNMKIRSSSLAAALVSPQLTAAQRGLESSGHGGTEGGVDSARSTPLTTTIPLAFDTHSQRPASRSSREGSGLDRPSSRGGLSSLPSTSASAMAGGLSPASSTAAALGLHSDTVPGPSGLGPVQSVPLSLKKEIDCSEDDNSNSRHHLQPRSASASGVLGGELDYRTPHESLLRNFGMATRCPTPFAFPFTPLGLSLFDIDPSRILTMLHHQTWLAEEALRNRGLLTPPPTSKDFSQRFNPLGDLLSKDYHANHMHLNTADLLARSSLSSAALAATTSSAAHFGGPTDLASKQTQQHRSTPQQQQYKQQQQQPPFNIRYPSPAAFFHQQHQHQQLQQQLQTQKLTKSTRQSTTPSPQQTATSSGPSLLSASSSTSLSSLHKSSERSLTPCHNKDDDNDGVIELTTSSHHDEAAAIRDRDSGNSSAATTSSITSSMLYKDSLEQLLQRRHSSGMMTGEASLKSYSQLLLNSTTPTDTSSCKEKSSSSSTSSTPPPAPGTPGQLSLSRSSLLKSPSDTSSLFSEPIEEETRCIVCNAQFPNVWLLEQHAALQHPLLGPAYAKHKETNHRARLPADKLFTCDVCGMQFRYLKSFKKHRLNHALERLHGKKGKNPFAAHLQQQLQEHEMVTSSQEPNLMMADTDTVEDLRINIKKEREEEEQMHQQQQQQQHKQDEEQDATVDSAGLMSYQENQASANIKIQTNSNEPNISSSEGIHSTNKRPRLLQASLTSHIETDSSYHSNHQQQHPAPPPLPPQQQHHPHTLVHHPHLAPQLPGHLAHNMSAMAAAAAAATTPQHQQQMTPQTAQQAAVAAAAAAANSMNSLNSLNSITSLINAERLPNEQFLGLNPQEASILNFLRVDAQERQRDKRPPASRFACPFCGKCVRSKENLKLHVRKHTGERPFVCLFCGRAFGGKSDLTRHLRIHTGERPYHCESCGKCFARADYLSKHLTTHIHNAPR